MSKTTKLHPLVAAHARRRRWSLGALAGANMAALVAVAALRVEPVASGGFLGFAWSVRPWSWRTLVTFVVLMIVQMILTSRAARLALVEGRAVQIHPPPKEPQQAGAARRYGTLSPAEIVALVLETARASGVHRIDRIYLLPTPVPNAFTARIAGLGTVVALHSNLFDFLAPAGIRAIIAHEVAHIRRGDSFARQVTSAPGMFALVVFVVVLLQLAGGVLVSTSLELFVRRATLLALVIGLALLARDLVRRLSASAAREAEFLADAHAAGICGLESTANTLLLLGERTEALATLTESLAAVARRAEPDQAIARHELLAILERFPAGELEEQVARRVAPRLLIEERLSRLRDRLAVPLSPEQIAELASAGAAQIFRESQAATAVNDTADVTDWRHYDLDASGHLDRAELLALVEALRAAPDRMLFRVFLSLKHDRDDHPPVRDRIVFLADLHRAESARA